MTRQSKLSTLTAVSLMAGIDVSSLLDKEINKKIRLESRHCDDSKRIQAAAEKRHRKQLRQQALLRKEQLLSQLD